MDYPLIVRTSFDIEYRCIVVEYYIKKKKNYTRKNKKYRILFIISFDYFDRAHFSEFNSPENTCI